MQIRLAAARTEADSLRRIGTPWLSVLDRVPAWGQALMAARAGLRTDGVWAGAARILDSAHRSLFLIALGIPTQTKGIPLFRLLWLLCEGAPRLGSDVAEEAIVTLGRLSLQPV